MSRVYYADEFEEAILANTPNCCISLTQLAKLNEENKKKEQLMDPPVEEEDDFLAELKVKALFEKLNPRREVPGQLSKPEPKFYDQEIKRLIEETRQAQISRGVVTVMSNGEKPDPPEQAPRRKGKKKKTTTSSGNDPIVISSSSDSVEIVELEPKKPGKLVINPVAIRNAEKLPQPKASSSKNKAPAPKNVEPIVISSSGESPESEKLKKAKKKFYTPKELYDMKKKL